MKFTQDQTNHYPAQCRYLAKTWPSTQTWPSNPDKTTGSSGVSVALNNPHILFRASYDNIRVFRDYIAEDPKVSATESFTAMLTDTSGTAFTGGAGGAPFWLRW